MFLRGSVALLLFLSLGTLCCANQNIDNEGIFHSSLLESENVRSILFKRSPQEVNNSDVANSTISDTQDEDIPSPDNAVPRAIFSTPSIRLSSPSYTAPVGSNYIVQCSGNSNNLTWYYPDFHRIVGTQGSPRTVLDRIHNTSQLVFDAVRSEHAGHYRCVNTILRSTVGAEFVLTIQVAQLNPTVKLSSDQHAGVLGTRFSVICSGNSPNLTWTDPFSRNVSQLQNPSIRVFNNRLSNTSELIFESIAKEYEGYYSCSNNILGRSVLAQFKLSSIVPRPTVRLSPVDKKVEKYPTQKYSVICYGNSNNITWKTPNNAIVFARTPGSRDDPYTVIGNLQVELIFEDIKLYQRGVYKCSVGLSGFQETASFELAVNDIPRLELTPPVEYGTVEVKGEYRIKCEHKKVSNIQWKGPDDKIITSHSDKIQARSSSHASELIIKRAANRFSGIYTCVGQADGLSVFRPFTLSVTRRQRLSEPSFGSLKAILMQKKVGEGFNVTCEGDTNQIYWRGPPSSDVISTDYTQRIHTKNVVNVDDDEYTLELNAKNLQLGDAGSYTCQVIDGVELKDRSFKLSVIEPVHFIKDLPSQYHVVEGKDIILNCGARGYPTPVIEWYKRNSTSSLKLDALSIEHAINGDELTLKNASYKFAGTYTCNARQEIIGGNNGERSMDLKVYHKPTFPDGPNVTLYNYLGRPINIMCIVVSEPAALYTWSRNGTRIIFRSPNNFMARPFDSKNDFGNYECEATNEYGSTFQNITVLEGEKPAAPGFKIRSVNNTDIRIELTSKQNSTTHYVVEYLIKDQDKQFNNFTLAKGKTNNYILHMKKAKTKYLLRAATINNIEQSPFTKNETVITGSATVARFSLAMQLYLVIVLVAIIPYQFCY